MSAIVQAAPADDGTAGKAVPIVSAPLSHECVCFYWDELFSHSSASRPMETQGNLVPLGASLLGLQAKPEDRRELFSPCLASGSWPWDLNGIPAKLTQVPGQTGVPTPARWQMAP